MVHNIIMMLLVIILPLQLQTELSFGVSAPSKMHGRHCVLKTFVAKTFNNLLVGRVDIEGANFASLCMGDL